MEANLLDYFPRVFLDLKFIDKKITNFGAADLLLDFRKYQKFIARVSNFCIFYCKCKTINAQIIKRQYCSFAGCKKHETLRRSFAFHQTYRCLQNDQ